MDRRDREREMVSALLPALSPAVVAPEQATLGFTRLLASADDLALDTPEAAHLLSLFLGGWRCRAGGAPRCTSELGPSPRQSASGAPRASHTLAKYSS